MEFGAGPELDLDRPGLIYGHPKPVPGSQPPQPMDYQHFLNQLPACYHNWGTDQIRPKSDRFQTALAQLQGMTTANVMQGLFGTGRTVLRNWPRSGVNPDRGLVGSFLPDGLHRTLILYLQKCLEFQRDSQIYQILSNCFWQMNQSELAIASLQTGISHYPEIEG